AGYNAVSPDYFKVLRIPILKGRGILESDTESAPHVAVINQSMAQRFWPGRDAVGEQFTLGQDPNHLVQVVGIVKDARMAQLTGPIEPFFFMSIAQNYTPLQTLQLRSSGTLAAVSRPVLEMIRSLEPGLPVAEVQMNQVLDGPDGFLIFRLGA